MSYRRSDWAAARWAFKEKQPAGRFTGTLPTARFQYRPLEGRKGSVAVLGIVPDDLEDDFLCCDCFRASVDYRASRPCDRPHAPGPGGGKSPKRRRKGKSCAVRCCLPSPTTSGRRWHRSWGPPRVCGRSASERMTQSEKTRFAGDDLRKKQHASRGSSRTSSTCPGLKLARSMYVVTGSTSVTLSRSPCNEPGETVRAPSRLISQRDLPLIQCDATLLGQVMINLVDNAIKYQRAGVCHRRGCETARRSDQRQRDRRRHWHTTQRPVEGILRNSTAFAGSDGRATGTGLGLSICAGLINAMGGSIAAASPIADERGTRQTILLPVAAPSRIGEKEHP